MGQIKRAESLHHTDVGRWAEYERTNSEQTYRCTIGTISMIQFLRSGIRVRGYDGQRQREIEFKPQAEIILD